MKKNEVLLVAPPDPGRPFFTIVDRPDDPAITIASERDGVFINFKATVKLRVHPEHMQGKAVKVELKR